MATKSAGQVQFSVSEASVTGDVVEDTAHPFTGLLAHLAGRKEKLINDLGVVRDLKVQSIKGKKLNASQMKSIEHMDYIHDTIDLMTNLVNFVEKEDVLLQKRIQQEKTVQKQARVQEDVALLTQFLHFKGLIASLGELDVQAYVKELPKTKKYTESQVRGLLSLVDSFNCERHFGQGHDVNHTSESRDSLTKVVHVISGSKKTVVGDVHGRRCFEIINDLAGKYPAFNQLEELVEEIEEVLEAAEVAVCEGSPLEAPVGKSTVILVENVVDGQQCAELDNPNTSAHFEIGTFAIPTENDDPSGRGVAGNEASPVSTVGTENKSPVGEQGDDGKKRVWANSRKSKGQKEGKEFKPRGDGEFKPRGEGEFKPRRNGDFKPRGDGEFKPRGDGEFRPRRNGDFKPRGDGEFKPRGEGSNWKPRREGNGERRDVEPSAGQSLIESSGDGDDFKMVSRRSDDSNRKPFKNANNTSRTFNRPHNGPRQNAPTTTGPSRQ
uniref:Caprin-1_dimer domain-containing protein n=1 Tax=Rhabditophanes sp. KR3021 TaxID=114890 RepID=A0AC35TK00_9BILA